MFKILFGLMLAPLAIAGALFSVALIYASIAATIGAVVKGFKRARARKEKKL